MIHLRNDNIDEVLPCAVILTAIPVEYEAVREHLADLAEEIYKGTIYERGSFQGNTKQWQVGIAQVGMGNVLSGMHAERAINYFNPSVVIFVGVAGGIKDVELGDVVVAEKAYDYEFGKVSAEAHHQIYNRPEVGISSYIILERAKKESRSDDWLKRIVAEDKGTPKAIVKPIATGEKVITSTQSETYKIIREHFNDAVAVEMEGCGFLFAARINDGIQALIVRGVSDLIDDKEQADGAGFQVIAAKNAAAFAFEVLSKFTK